MFPQGIVFLVPLLAGLLIIALRPGRKWPFKMPFLFQAGEPLSTRVCRIAAWATVLSMMGIFFYFSFRFPDAPIHKCSSHGYCGKQGQPHSPEDYVSFSGWQSVLFYSWPPGILLLGLLHKRIPKPPDEIPKNVKQQIESRAAPDYDKIRDTYRSNR
jgi:hypothetical protein